MDGAKDVSTSADGISTWIGKAFGLADRGADAAGGGRGVQALSS